MRLQTPTLAAILVAALLPPRSSLSQSTPVPDLLTGTVIRVDGCPVPAGMAPCLDDWNGIADLAVQSTVPLIRGRVAVSHPRLAGEQRQDTLYLYLAISDGSKNAGIVDSVILMLDVDRDHAGSDTDDRGVLFKRDGTMRLVHGNPSAPSDATDQSSIAGIDPTLCNDTQRVCIKPSAGGGTTQWAIEAKLVLADFGLAGFDGSIAGIIVAKDADLMTTGLWPENTDPADPTKWQDLKFWHPIDLALVLDVSGSMGSAACQTCATKFSLMQRAVEITVQAFKLFAVPADRATLRYFESFVSDFPTGGGLVPVVDQADLIIDNVNSRGPLNGTSMGGGVQSAVNRLSNTSQRRSVIVFTDGMQNINPMVLVNSNTLTIEEVTGIPQTSGIVCVPTPPGAPCPTQLTPTSPVSINTIGVGATPQFQSLLTDIATATSGTAKMTTDPDADMVQLYVEQLLNALRNNSPQLLDYRHGTTTPAGAETFTSNSSSRRIVLMLIWTGNDSLTFRVKKDGVDVTDAGEIVRGSFYRFFALNLPATTGSEQVLPGGDWRMEIAGPSGVAYQAAAISDELLLDYETSIEPAKYVTGQPLRLAARVTVEGVPVTDARVSVTVLKPRFGTGTLLSTNPMPAPPATFRPEPLATAAENKLLLLLSGRARSELSQPTSSLTLESRGDGTYAGSVSGTQVEGVYTVIFTIQGERSDVGVYRRTERRSQFVQFGKASFGKSGVRLTSIDRTKDVWNLLLHLRPRDQFGNYLGPDYAHRIRVTLSPGSVEGQLKDLVDGSYTVPLLVPANSDPALTITVLDQPLFQGPLSEFEAPRWGGSLHAGLSFPMGSLKNAYDQGLGGTIDFTRRLNDRWSVSALVGYHRFNGAVTAGAPTPDLELYHTSASLEATVLTSGPFAFLADAGGGMYRFNPGSTKPGAHAGVGLEYGPSLSLALGISARAHTVFTGGSNTTFAAIQAGGRVMF